jgi:hypothetical protein
MIWACHKVKLSSNLWDKMSVPLKKKKILHVFFPFHLLLLIFILKLTSLMLLNTWKHLEFCVHCICSKNKQSHGIISSGPCKIVSFKVRNTYAVIFADSAGNWSVSIFNFVLRAGRISCRYDCRSNNGYRLKRVVVWVYVLVQTLQLASGMFAL